MILVEWAFSRGEIRRRGRVIGQACEPIGGKMKFAVLMPDGTFAEPYLSEVRVIEDDSKGTRRLLKREKHATKKAKKAAGKTNDRAAVLLA